MSNLGFLECIGKFSYTFFLKLAYNESLSHIWENSGF